MPGALAVVGSNPTGPIELSVRVLFDPFCITLGMFKDSDKLYY